MSLYSGAMKRLTLMRHAKSSWDKPDVHDFDRTLNERGRKAAPLMGVYMKENRLIPDCILCSSAVRTRQTLELILPYFDGAAEVSFSDRLYLASPGEMLKQIKAVSDQYAHILIIAHNPGTHMLALNLIDPDHSNSAAIAILAENFPTAALAHFELEITRWREANSGRGALKTFTTPRSL